MNETVLPLGFTFTVPYSKDNMLFINAVITPKMVRALIR